MDNSKFIQIIIFIVFILGLIVYITYNEIDINDINNQINKEYPSINKHESISGYVTNIFIPQGFRNYPYGATIVLNDTIKRSFVSYSKPRGLVVDEVLKIGSYIRKVKGSNTLIIYNTQDNDTIVFRYNLDDPSLK